MKKLLCVAIFSIAIMASAVNKKENVTSNTKEVNVEKSDFSKKTENSMFNEEVKEASCSSQGNSYYSIQMEEGMSHREARTARRAYVRKCRGGGWTWILGVYTFDTIGL